MEENISYRSTTTQGKFPLWARHGSLAYCYWTGSVQIFTSGATLVGFGLIDAVGGIAMSETGLGAIAGIPLAAVGVDQVITGARNIAYGKRDRAGVEELVYAATGSETAAVLLPAAATLSLWAVGPRLARAGVRAGAGGFTLPGSGAPTMACATQAERLELLVALLDTATTTPFTTRALALGFTAQELDQLPHAIMAYFARGGLGYKAGGGGFASGEALLIGRGGYLFNMNQRMRHELGHVLDEIARPGIMAASMANARQFGLSGFARAEWTAFGTQFTGPIGLWVVRPWYAGATAMANVYGKPGFVFFAILTGGPLEYGGYRISNSEWFMEFLMRAME